LFCDFGGILGLYVGFSLMTVFEFVDLGFELLVAAVASITKRVNGDGSGPAGHRAFAVGRTGEQKNNTLSMDLEDAGTPPPDYYHSDSLESIGKKKMTEVVC
jgi:hypothetical protein